MHGCYDCIDSLEVALVFVKFCALLLQTSLNGSTSSLADNTGRTFSSTFSAQSGAGSAVFHHSGELIFGVIAVCFLQI